MQIIRRMMLIIMAVLLLPFAAGAEESGNLLVNGGFELLDDDGLPTGWYTDAYLNREGVTVYSMTGDSHSGSNAAVIENFGMNDARYAQRVKVQPNTMYRLSGYIYTEGIEDSGRGANLSIEGGYYFSQSVFDSEGGWTYVETYGETGPEQESLVVFVRLGGYSGESVGRATFDDISLTQVDELPEGVYARAWYQIPTEEVIDAGVEDVESEAAEPFWPWLLLIAAGYASAALWLMRHYQLDDQAAALREAGQRNGKFKPGMPAFAVIGLLVAAAARILVALRVDGYQVDVNCFTAWGNTMANVGPSLFYQSNWCDYTPGYVYVMGLNGAMANVLGSYVSTAFVHKLIPMASDLIGAWLVYRLATEHRYTRRQAGLLALLMAFNPAIFLNSAAWCQIDSVLCIGLMLVAYFAIHRRWEVVLPVYVACILVKPQALMLGFLGLAAIVMELIKNRKDAKIWRQMGLGLLISAVVAAVVILPFSPNQTSATWLTDLYGKTLASYPYATVNTANLYFLAGANWDSIVYNAETSVIVFFMLACAAWGGYAFLRRKDKTLTILEPAIVALAVILVVVLALGVMPLLNDTIPLADRFLDGAMLTRGDPWIITKVNDQYVRTFEPDTPGAWWIEIPAYAFLAAAVVIAAGIAVLVVLLVRRSKRDHSTGHWGLVEPVMMALFVLAFAGMLIFDTTWTALGVVAMALAFALVLPMFIRSGKLTDLPLCGAVLFVLLYVFGIKMHERYLFPALFLLGMAYAIRRDRRVLGLLIGLSCVLLVNEGVILDNSLRLGSSMGHLNYDNTTLANCLSVLNVAFALASVWVCHRVCVEDAPVKLAKSIGEPVFPVRSHEKRPCTPLNFKPSAKVRLTRKDALLMLIVTAIYSVVTLTTLGSTKAPQNPWKSTAYNESVYIDLGQHYDDFTMLYYCQVSYSNFSVATSETGEEDDWSDNYEGYMRQGECFRWRYLCNTVYKSDGYTVSYQTTEYLSGRFVRITAEQVGLVMNEVIFRDAEGNRIPAQVMGAVNANEKSPLLSDPENLLDEQDTLDGEPGWWNSTYFDEIYHARTAFEHLNGTSPYEVSHPPLGKVIMSWFVGIFGMTPFGWRFAGALCGILMLPAMYLLAKQLTRRTDMAFVAMMLMALDCMHFTQTRIATIDSFPVLFIILSFYFMLRFMQHDIVLDDMKKLLPDLALSGFFMGCGVASKWIGVYAGCGLAVLYFWTCLRHLRMGKMARSMQADGNAYTQEEREILEKRDKRSFRRVLYLCLWCLLFFVLVPVVIYLLSYLPYFAYLKIDSPVEYLRRVIDAQKYMLEYHSTPGLGMDHPYYSPWYEWPLMMQPMYFASPSNTPEGWSYAIWCFGNPWVWVVGLVGIGYTVFRWAKGHRYRLAGSESTMQLYRDDWDVSAAFVLIGLLAQFLPWMLVPRGTYIYHYFASVPFLILGTTLFIHYLTKRWPAMGRIIWIIYLALCAVWFVLLFPHASGVLAPEWWLNFVYGYPWGVKGRLYELLSLIPIFPNF